MGKNKNNLIYNNRELSWVDFNFRVLEEAMDKKNPIMERLKFLSITASNLDEFFMVRVSNVMERLEDKPYSTDNSGLKPKHLLQKLTEKIHKFSDSQYSCLYKSIIPDLKKSGIEFLDWDELSMEQKLEAGNYFEKIIFPVLTPLAVDTSRPFPILSNKSINIAVELINEGEHAFGIVQVPSMLPRYFRVSDAGRKCYILIEDIITNHLTRLFELHNIKSSCVFRITRNADLEIDEDAEDLLTEIEKSIKKRKRGELIRLEIGHKRSKEIKDFLTDMLDVGKKETYKIKGPLDLTFFSKFYSEKWDSKLKFKKLSPVNPPADFCNYDNIFDSIRERDLTVYHPFESFDCVVKFVKEAAEDKDVLAIKQTLYRVSGNSPIIDALIKAAENGKQVTVLVELKARFDEENNIVWARKLEKAGCHVIYGLAGLKTHCKVLLVVRKEKDCIRRYIHIATGNYNDNTAKLYTDIGLFTCKERFGMDASSLFNSLTGYSRPPEYQKLIVAPSNMRGFFVEKIQNEIENAKSGMPSGIIIKVNSIVDKNIIDHLYKASCAGVNIKLIVRGMCCLVPGIKDVSENITVISIIGRLLEHSRIFYFENGGDPQIYMGSADIMPRNLDRRVEVLFPIDDERLKRRSVEILDVLLSDTVNARIQKSNTEYKRCNIRGRQIIDSQSEFFKISQYAKDSELKSDDMNIFTKINPRNNT